MKIAIDVSKVIFYLFLVALVLMGEVDFWILLLFLLHDFQFKIDVTDFLKRK